MLTIARLFGKSPFAALRTHMSKVANCIEKLTKVFDALAKKEIDKIERLVIELSALEHEADLTKNDIRNHLPKSLFIPIDRGQFLEILSIQDSIADKAEDVGVLLTLRPEDLFKESKVSISRLFKQSAEVFWSAKQIIDEIDGLLESSFGGLEAEKVKSMVEQTAFKEYEAVNIQRLEMQSLFSHGEQMSAPSFYLWLRLIEEISKIAELSEKLANRIRMVLELK